MISKNSSTESRRKHKLSQCTNTVAPRHGYAEWVAKKSHHSMAIFTTKHAHILLSHLCGAKQGSSFACPSSNVVASLKSQAFFPPPTLAHKPLVNGYAFAFHSRDDRCLAQNLILIIQSYCDNDTRYTAALLLHQLIQQAQWSLDRAGDFPSSQNSGANIKNVPLIS